MKNYDSSWDKGNEELWDKKYEEWEERKWFDWLDDNLTLPFEVERVESMDSNPFADHSEDPFAVGETMTVTDLEDEDEMRGVIAWVSKGGKRSCISLADVEVISKGSQNFWSIREYVVWFANQ